MTKTNYKLIAKKHLKNLEKEYEELKIKNNDEYFEDDNYICDISDLEHLLESNGDYTVKRTYTIVQQFIISQEIILKI